MMTQQPHIHSLAFALNAKKKELERQRQEYVAKLPKKKPHLPPRPSVSQSQARADNIVTFAQKVLDPIIVKKASSYPAAKAARQSMAAGMTPRNALPDLSITSVVETETESPDTDTDPVTPVSLTA